MAQGAMTILRRRWPELGLIGAANLLAQILTYAVVAVLLVPALLGFMGFRRGLVRPDGSLREVLALLAGAAGLAGLVVAPVLLVAAAFMLAGLVGAVARLRRGEPVGLLAYWVAGARGFGRALLVVLLFGVGVVVALVLLLAVMRWWGALLWGLLAVPAGLYGLLYPVYLSTVAGLGVWGAFGRSWRRLVADPGEAALLTLLVIGFAVLYSVVLGLFFRLGLLGHLLIGFLLLLAVPGLLLVLVDRFAAGE